MRSLFLLFAFLFIGQASAQEEINQLDANGKRHGLWRKTFEENPNQVRYEGRFEHGKETGLFTFYILGQDKPAATKFFSPDSDTAQVKFLTQKRKCHQRRQDAGGEKSGRVEILSSKF